MASSLAQFFSNYPSIDDVNLETKLFNKQEFHPEKEKELFDYQKLIARFINFYTPYPGLLILHGMGTGKTCTAINVVEKSRGEFKGAVVLTPNEQLLTNFKNELLFNCPSLKDFTLPKNFDQFTSNKRTREIDKLTHFYKFATFEKFAREIKNLENSVITTNFDNKIWIFDEAHEILTKDNALQYLQLLRVKDLCPNSRLLLLTGTPMIDSTEELASLLNFLLPPEQRIKNIKDMLTSDGRANDTLRQIFRGRVSFLRQVLKKTFVGETIGTLKHMQVFVSEMIDKQKEIYYGKSTLNQEENQNAQNFFMAERQIDLAVFPDGSYTQENEEKFVKNLKLTTVAANFFNTRDDLKKVSCKYFALFERLDDAIKHGRNVYVYSEFVAGVGLHYLIALLKHFGFNKFIYLDSKISVDKLLALIAEFNLPVNANGNNYNIILGSKKTATGITLKNVQQVEILTPDWNFKTTLQTIARGIRVGSQKDIKNPIFEIALYVALPAKNDITNSISLKMFEIAEDKDILINHLERDLQECSFDCLPNFDKNFVAIKEADNTPDCQYLPCDYKCLNEPTGEPSSRDKTTFNLFFSQPLVNSTRAAIVNYFENIGAVQNFDQIAALVPEKNNFILFTVLEELIEKNWIFRTCYVLRERDNMFFLTPINKPDHFFYDSWYIDNPITFLNNDNGNKIITNFVNQTIFAQIRDTNNMEGFYLLDRNTQANIFEYFWLIGKTETQIFDYFSNYFNRQRAIHWINLPIVRQFVDDKWQNASEKMSFNIVNELKTMHDNLEKNKFGYIGQYTKRYMAVQDPIKREKERKNFCIKTLKSPSSGLICANVPNLDKIFEDLQITPPQKKTLKEEKCNMLFDKFGEYNLLIEDPKCGQQSK